MVGGLNAHNFAKDWQRETPMLNCNLLEELPGELRGPNKQFQLFDC